MSFSQALSGLNAQSENLKILSNNIANSQTVGFKTSKALFADVFATSRVGLGVSVADVTQDFSSGDLETTGRTLDLAVAGEGFYRMETPSGNTAFTRNGQFNQDADGFLVNAAGQKLTGYGLSDPNDPFSEVLGGSDPQALRVPATDMPANATTEVNATFNLDARELPTGPKVVGLGTSTPPAPPALFTIANDGESRLEGELLYPDGENLRVNEDGNLVRPTDNGYASAFNVRLQQGELVATNDAGADFTPDLGEPDMTVDVNTYINNAGEAYYVDPTTGVAQERTDTGADVYDINGVGWGDVALEYDGTTGGDFEVVRLNDGTLTSFGAQNNGADVDIAPDARSSIATSLHNGDYTIDRTGLLIDQDGNQARVDNAGDLLRPTEAGYAAGNNVRVISLEQLNEPRTAATSNFNPDDPNSYTFSNSFNVFDSLGNARSMTLYFSRSDGDNKWAMDARLSGATPEEPSIEKFVGVVSFDENGNLQAGDENDLTFDALSPTITFGNSVRDNDVSGEVEQLSFELDLSGTTQFANTSLQSELRQDGYTSGTLVGIDVRSDGTVVRNFSNEQTAEAGQIVLTRFANLEGLEPIGENAFRETNESGIGISGVANTGIFGSIESGVLENSNVDLAQQLVDTIVAQRAYQANSTTIGTQDEILQTIINL